MPDYLAQLRCRLAELGCPRARLNRFVREVADHREDLILSATSSGAPLPAAGESAARQLGDPLALADGLMTTLRRSTWWGRNYLFTFGFLPLLAIPILWAMILGSEFWIALGLGYGWDDKKLHQAADNLTTWHHLAWYAYGADYVALGLVALLFCWLGRRSGVSLFWMIMACLVCATYALVTFTHVARHNYSIGLTYFLQWTRAAIPLGVAFAACLYHWLMIRLARRQTAG